MQFRIGSKCVQNCNGKTNGSNPVPMLCQARPRPSMGTGQSLYTGNNICVLQIEQVSQLAALVQAQLEYHSRAAEILQQLSSKMEDRY